MIKSLLTAILILGAMVFISIFFAACGNNNNNSTTGDDDTGNSADDDTTTDDDSGDDDTASKEFRAGFAKIDITPTVPVKMAGFGMAFFSVDNCRWSTGVHDPLYARAAAFDDPNGVAPIVIIVLDDVGTITNDIVRIQAGVAAVTGIPEKSVIVASTHTHHGPDTIGLWGVIVPPITGRDEDVINKMVDGSIQAGINAWKARVPATLKFAVGKEARYHHNKIWLDPNRTIDDTLTVLAAYDHEDNLLGSIINWSCHPTVMGQQNTLISADYPGALCRIMEEDMGGTHVYINGAIGASIQPINPDHPIAHWIVGYGTWDDVDRFGRHLAEDTESLLEQATIVDDPNIWLLELRDLSVKVENLLFVLAARVKLMPREVPGLGEYATTYLATFAMGPVTFATVPGEYVPNYAYDLRQLMGGDAQFIIGLGLDWIGYAITPQQHENLAYIYEELLCPSKYAGEELMTVYHGVWDPINAGQ